MMKYKVHFVCGVLLCGSAEGAMTPAGRALVPQAQLASQAGTMPAALRDSLKITEKLKKEGKVHYVQAFQPTPPAAVLDKQKILDQEVNKTLAIRKSRVNILSNAIKSRYVDDMSYPEFLLDIFVDVPLIKSTLYALCIDTSGCSADAAVKELNEMHRSVLGMREWVTGTEAFPMIEELRNNSCRFDRLVSILHDNMGMLSLRNANEVTGSTLDGMVYKKNMYPNLAEAFQSYLRRKDESEFRQQKWNFPINLATRLLRDALMNSANDKEELEAFENSFVYKNHHQENKDVEVSLQNYKKNLESKVN